MTITFLSGYWSWYGRPCRQPSCHCLRCYRCWPAAVRRRFFKTRKFTAFIQNCLSHIQTRDSLLIHGLSSRQFMFFSYLCTPMCCPFAATNLIAIIQSWIILEWLKTIWRKSIFAAQSPTIKMFRFLPRKHGFQNGLMMDLCFWRVLNGGNALLNTFLQKMRGTLY